MNFRNSVAALLAVMCAGIVLFSGSATGSMKPGAVVEAAGQFPQGGPGGGHPDGGGPGGFGPRGLNLTDAQREQIRAIQTAENARIQSFLTQVRTTRCAIETATAKGQFNETQIRSLASAASNAEVELAVSRERVQAAIYNQVYTADQKAKVDAAEAERTARLCGSN